MLGLPCSAVHCCPIANMAMAGEYDTSDTSSVGKNRNVNEPEWDSMGKWTTMTRTLTNIDAKSLSQRSERLKVTIEVPRTERRTWRMSR